MRKNFLWIFLITLLILSVLNGLGVNIIRVSAQVSPYIAVIPESTWNPSLTPGENYTVSIYTDYNGSDVWGYEFTLYYDPNILNGTEVTNGDLITPEKDPLAVFGAGTFDNEEGFLSLTLAWFFWFELPPYLTSGPGILANITFTVVGEGFSDITLDETRLIGYDGDFYNIIDGTMPGHIQHGFFSNIIDAAVIDVIPAADQAYPTWTTPLNITVTVLNNATAPANFTVRAYYENVTAAYEIGTQNVINLGGGSQLNLTFNWNLTDVGWGIYTTKANVTLTGDGNPANDEFVYSNVTIKIPGDIQGDTTGTPSDGDVDRYDFGAFAQAYGYSYPHPSYNVECDFDRDGDVDRYDFGIFAEYYGQSTTKYP